MLVPSKRIFATTQSTRMRDRICESVIVERSWCRQNASAKPHSKSPRLLYWKANATKCSSRSEIFTRAIFTRDSRIYVRTKGTVCTGAACIPRNASWFRSNIVAFFKYYPEQVRPTFTPTLDVIIFHDKIFYLWKVRTCGEWNFCNIISNGSS